MIGIVNPRIFVVENESRYHWSKLPIKQKMETEIFEFQDLDMSHSDLTFGNFSYFQFKKVSLEYSSISDSNFSNIEMTDCSVKNGNLYNVNMSYSSFKRTSFAGASLAFSNCRGSNFFGCDLSNTDLKEADLMYADLSNANLENTNINEANIRFTNMTGARLRRIDDKEVYIKNYLLINPIDNKGEQGLIFFSNIGMVVMTNDFYGLLKDYVVTNKNEMYIQIIKLMKKAA